MKKRLVITAAVVALTLAGCAAGSKKPDPLNRQELLVFAGFLHKIAATQEDLDQVSGIPQRELLRISTIHPPMYIWADAAGCRCYYVGDEKSFLRLEELGWRTGRN